jgi:hypothetical protein
VAQSKIVAHFRDGRILKGFTGDFAPSRDKFHLLAAGAPGAKPVEVPLAALKAVYFVRDFAGDPARVDAAGLEAGKPAAGRRVRVHFDDGEQLVGTTQAYHPERTGFFVVPADPASNNERCFVVLAATREVSFV